MLLLHASLRNVQILADRSTGSTEIFLIPPAEYRTVLILICCLKFYITMPAENEVNDQRLREHPRLDWILYVTVKVHWY